MSCQTAGDINQELSACRSGTRRHGRPLIGHLSTRGAPVSRTFSHLIPGTPQGAPLTPAVSSQGDKGVLKNESELNLSLFSGTGPIKRETKIETTGGFRKGDIGDICPPRSVQKQLRYASFLI